jgi:hypothetical protein
MKKKVVHGLPIPLIHATSDTSTMTQGRCINNLYALNNKLENLNATNQTTKLNTNSQQTSPVHSLIKMHQLSHPLDRRKNRVIEEKK